MTHTSYTMTSYTDILSYVGGDGFMVFDDRFMVIDDSYMVVLNKCITSTNIIYTFDCTIIVVTFYRINE